ncbi:hypothetical protein [Dactylosporangium sp. NPDC050588]|uniref:hypothetical protein n=1 Tax=Dactylosporangium sp. NPDC050588 TaxID=3157211 RepID=UPI0033D7C09F
MTSKRARAWNVSETTPKPRHGATNVQWLWCFNNGSAPDSSFNDPAQSYPGDAYVDWAAIDATTGFGPSWDPAGNHWTSFDSTFSSVCAKARAIAPKRPMMAADRFQRRRRQQGQWIDAMSAVLNSGSYPDLKLIRHRLSSGVTTGGPGGHVQRAEQVTDHRVLATLVRDLPVRCSHAERPGDVLQNVLPGR